LTNAPATQPAATNGGATLTYAVPVMPLVARLPAILWAFVVVGVITPWVPISAGDDMSIASEFGDSFLRMRNAPSRGDALATIAICWPLLFAPVGVGVWSMLSPAWRHRPAAALGGWLAAASALVAPLASAGTLLGFSSTGSGAMWAFIIVIPVLLVGAVLVFRSSKALGPAYGVPAILSLAYACASLIVLLLTVPNSFQPFGHGSLFVATVLAVVNVLVLYRRSRSWSH
jgi:hypothetical protein